MKISQIYKKYKIKPSDIFDLLKSKLLDIHY